MTQLYTFFNFILTGVVIGILFDIFRILRKSFKTLDLITYVQDFIFLILTGIIMLYSIFTFNNGEIRGYVIIGVFLGIMIYILLLSKYFINIMVKFISLIKKVVYYPLHILSSFIIKNIFKPIHNIAYQIFLKLPKINLKKKKSDNLSDKIQ